MGSKFLSYRVSYKANSQAKQYAIERNFFRFFDGRKHVLYGFFAEADLAHFAGYFIFHYFFKAQQFIFRKVIKMIYGPHQAFIEKQFNFTFAQAFDVHGFAGNKMLKFALDLRRTTIFVRTVKICFAFRSNQQTFTFRAMIYISYRKTSRNAFRNIYAR